MMNDSVEMKYMCKFGLLLTNMGLFIMLSGCVQRQISSIDTMTPQPVRDFCLEEKLSNSNIQLSQTDIPDLSVNAVREEIIDYLNSGGSASGLQPLILDIQNNVIGSIVEIDLNNDSRKEIVLSTTTASRVDRYNFGWVGVYECQRGKYSASYAELGEFMEYVKIKSIQDAFNIGTLQVFVEYEWHGFSCTVGMQVLALSAPKWAWAFGNYLHCPANVLVQNNPTTGKTEIIFQGTLHDGMGLEPNKEVTQVYAVGNGEFQLQP
jgi:hypothetical protein